MVQTLCWMTNLVPDGSQIFEQRQRTGEKIEFYVSKASVESGVNLSEKIFNISWNVQDG